MVADNSLRVLIVDDEPLARERIRLYLKKHSDIRVIAECGNGREAIAMLAAKSIDLVFLDIQMPDLSGLELIDIVGLDSFPPVIFTTAYDEYAVKAFEVHAVDYLLKPFDEERFEHALSRAANEVSLRNGDQRQSIGNLIADRVGAARKRLLVRDGGQITIVDVDDIDYIEAAGNYLILHIDKTKHMIRETMKGALGRLDGSRFVRIHRSYIVNIDRIKSLVPQDHGDFKVNLAGGATIPLSRRFRSSVEDVLGDYLV